ncbi:MAG: radical SAM protein [Bacteroidaceae bacterium]|nr:radical SAM protein [Bacteroidaceae bacterium]
MSTFLWQSIVFGPIHSRRVGNSLGINISPCNGKICSFDCIYCECGRNPHGGQRLSLPSYTDVATAMETRFRQLHQAGEKIDSISFTGNGEPTLHPDFEQIIGKTVELRDTFFPNAQVSVFSNSTNLHKESVRRALNKIDNPILKLDTLNPELLQLINAPAGNVTIERIMENLRLMKGEYILQTMFLRGEYDGIKFDNSAPQYAVQWQNAVLELRPRKVMMYSIDRETPVKELEKVTPEQMQAVAAPLIKAGIDVQING